jgi:predicted transcriptional regulator
MNDELSVLLTRTNELLSILVKVQLQAIIQSELAETKKRKLYDLTGGDLSIKELARRLDMSTGSISHAWQKWDEVGLVIKRNGKYRRTFE